MSSVNKIYLVHKTLTLFNIHLTDSQVGTVKTITSQVGGNTITHTEDTGLNTATHEVYLCSMWLESAYDRVIHSFKWSFLTEPFSLEIQDKSNLESDLGFRFVYKIKTNYDEETDTLKKKKLVDIVSIYRQDKRQMVAFKRQGDYIYTNEVNLHGLGIFKLDLESETVFRNYYPSEFIDLICYQLALLIAPSIAPKDMQIQQLIAQQYSMAQESLLKNECNQIKRFSNEEVE